jgi:hypothetical protein
MEQRYVLHLHEPLEGEQAVEASPAAVVGVL